MDKDKLKWYLKEGIKARTYQKRLYIACNFPQDEIEIMIDEIIDEHFPGALAEITNEDGALPIPDVVEQLPQQICYKTNEPCKYNCQGLCKESC